MTPARLPRLSDHGSEIVLLGALGVGVLILIGTAIAKDKLIGLDVAAFLLVLQRIVEAVQKRWEQRGTDKLGALAAAAAPQPVVDVPAGTQDDPISTKDVG